MTSTRQATMLAAFGVALPYAVAVLCSYAMARAGDETTWDTVTGWLTLGACLLGASLCWPWLRARLAGASSRVGWVGWIALAVAALVVQFIAVFVVRFLVYYSWFSKHPLDL